MTSLKYAATGALLVAGLFGTMSSALAEEVSNPVTGYQVSIFRHEGGSVDFQGWIRLFNGTKDAGYVYIQNGLPLAPHLGSTKYVVIDIPVAMLDVTLGMLNSGKPVFITYRDNGNGANASAFLHVGGDALPLEEQAEFVARTFSINASALKAAQ